MTEAIVPGNYFIPVVPKPPKPFTTRDLEKLRALLSDHHRKPLAKDPTMQGLVSIHDRLRDIVQEKNAERHFYGSLLSKEKQESFLHVATAVETPHFNQPRVSYRDDDYQWEWLVRRFEQNDHCLSTTTLLDVFRYQLWLRAVRLLAQHNPQGETILRHLKADAVPPAIAAVESMMDLDPRFAINCYTTAKPDVQQWIKQDRKLYRRLVRDCLRAGDVHALTDLIFRWSKKREKEDPNADAKAKKWPRAYLEELLPNEALTNVFWKCRTEDAWNHFRNNLNYHFLGTKLQRTDTTIARKMWEMHKTHGATDPIVYHRFLAEADPDFYQEAPDLLRDAAEKIAFSSEKSYGKEWGMHEDAPDYIHPKGCGTHRGQAFGVLAKVGAFNTLARCAWDYEHAAHLTLDETTPENVDHRIARQYSAAALLRHVQKERPWLLTARWERIMTEGAAPHSRFYNHLRLSQYRRGLLEQADREGLLPKGALEYPEPKR